MLPITTCTTVYVQLNRKHLHRESVTFEQIVKIYIYVNWILFINKILAIVMSVRCAFSM